MTQEHVEDALAAASGARSPFAAGQAEVLLALAEYLRCPVEWLVEWIHSDEAGERHWSIGAFRDYVERRARADVRPE